MKRHATRLRAERGTQLASRSERAGTHGTRVASIGRLLLLLPLAACNGSVGEAPVVGAGVITLGEGVADRRAPVHFDHSRHTRALEPEGCKACHEADARGRLVPRFARAADARLGADALQELYHDRCIGCHAEREKQGKPTGAVTCGECHLAGPVPATTRVAIRFDYSLHARHVTATGPEACGECHHVYDKALGKLVPGKGKEEGCVACHSARDRGKVPSLRNASHTACVGCHLKSVAAGKTSGPVLCVRCHDGALQQRIKRVEKPAPLDRKQPVVAWIKAMGNKSGGVAFDHKKHEPRARFCSTCHHVGLKPCASCHTLAGDPKGGGVTLELAQHGARSDHGCIGCHEKVTRKSECAGCHEQMAGAPPRPAACTVCHQTRGGDAPASQPAAPTVPELAALPAVSEAFPETVTIRTLERDYEPSVLPHAKIVGRLDRAVRGSTLARAFHGKTETLCRGCHHRSPAGLRPPPCRSCHAGQGKAGVDQPRLLNAYHRQCIGCHQKMSLKQDCASCHRPKSPVGGQRKPEGPR